jgi:hypothetical protein
LQSHEVTAALTQEAVRETVSELVRGEGTDAGPPGYAPHHSHQRLPTRRLLWILLPPDALVLRRPLLYFDGESVIIELRLEYSEQRPKLSNDVWIEWQPMPMPALRPGSVEMALSSDSVAP